MDGEGGEGLVPKEGGVGKVENLAEVVKVAKVAEQEREPSAFQLFFLLPTCEEAAAVQNPLIGNPKIQINDVKL